MGQGCRGSGRPQDRGPRVTAVRKGAAVVVALLAAAWPAVGGAQEEPVDTTVAPDTTVPPETTLPPDTTLPPVTTVPEPPPPPEVEPEPAPEARTLTVTPSTGLVHNQNVVVRGTGWPANSGALGAAQCISGTPDTSGCGSIDYFSSNALGRFRVDFEVEVILDTPSGTYDCRIETCVIGANNVPTATGARFVELAFDPAGPDPVRRTATATPDAGLVDGQVVEVAGSGFTAPEPS